MIVSFLLRLCRHSSSIGVFVLCIVVLQSRSSSSSSSSAFSSPPARCFSSVRQANRIFTAEVSSSLATQSSSSPRTKTNFVVSSRRFNPTRPSGTSTTTTTKTQLSLSPSDLSRSYDSLLERLPSQTILSAIDQFSGAPVTASDLSTAAGIPLSRARKELTALASLTRGDIAVSSKGELIYTFPKNVSSALMETNAKYKARKVWQDKAFPAGLYMTKVGFGLVLLASLVAIFSTIFFISTSGGGSDRDDDDRNRGRRGGSGGGMMMGMPGGFGGFWGPSPLDFFYYRPYYSRYYYVDDGTTTAKKRRNDDEMGFLESVFSYVFGDGNPNGDVEVRRLSLAADMIRKNGGAVSAEQLAPFCDDAPMPIMQEIVGGDIDKERAYVDESFVLPIVAQLDGEPQVTEEGDIVYVFPELMTSASSSSSSLASKESTQMRRESKILRRAGLEVDAPTSTIKTLLNMNRISTRGALERSDLIDVLEKALPSDEQEDINEDVDADPALLLEREFKFSLASPMQAILAGGLGVVNLGGALYLGNLLGKYASYGIRLPSYMGIIQQFYPLLLVYALLFNAIPLLRNLWIQGQNAKIQRRNETRKSWKALLERNVGSVKRKLAAAARFGRRMRQLGSGTGDVIFNTSMDLNEIDKMKEKDMMKEFDKILEEKRSGSAWE